MPQNNSILNMPGMTVKHMDGVNPIHVFAIFEGEVSCPRCKGRNHHKKKRFSRVLKHESIGNRRMLLHLESFQYRCRGCNRSS